MYLSRREFSCSALRDDVRGFVQWEAWRCWQRREGILGVVYWGFLFLLFGVYAFWQRDFNILALLQKGIGIANEFYSKVPFPIKVLVSALIPAIVVFLVASIIKFFALPGDKTGLLEAMKDRCSEVSRLGFKRLNRYIEWLKPWIDGLRTGVPVRKDEAGDIAKDLIGVTSAKELCATWLQDIDKAYANYRGAAEAISWAIRCTGQRKLIRFVVYDPTGNFNDTTDASKWFLGLHTDSVVSLMWVKREDFLSIASRCGVPENHLDVLLFDKKVVYSLENDPDPSKWVTPIEVNGCYRLYLLDEGTDVRAYGAFFDELKNVGTPKRN
ncbi:MAG: hypothetical protein KBC05_00490 [Candidatus Hydrogenedentes bacterium]|nr:hypothetical protein [Candidatus Hydrogenedentota bacterium]